MLDRRTLGAIVVAAGIALAGIFVGYGASKVRASDRYVTVKGVSEREVRADVAIWPINVTGADNDLAAAQAKLARSITGVRQFLARQAIDTSNIELAGFGASDSHTNIYRAERLPENRYILRQTIVVRSSDPERVKAASERIGELASIGVIVSSGAGGEYGGQGMGPTFLYTKLNELKPAMIAEATARAREAADQFARDSRSSVGSIRKANQGVFEIVGRDQAPGIMSEGQVAKMVRVVSTVEYFLK
jgi:uncharacterized protein